MFNDEKFDLEEIIKSAKSYSTLKDPLEYINDYNDQMSISQVVRFFEKQGIVFTKTMIQNYVRLGLLPPPLNKRYYTKEHFMILVMLYKFKDLYPLEVLRNIFAVSAEPSENEHIIGLYEAFLNMYRQMSGAIGNILPDNLKKAELVNDHQLSRTLMALLVQCSVTKQMADSFIEKHLK